MENKELKHKFEQWYLNKYVRETVQESWASHILSKFLQDALYRFYTLQPEEQWGVWQDFYDSEEVIIEIFKNPYDDQIGFTYVVNDMGDEILDTRPQARVTALDKAEEVYLGNTIKKKSDVDVFLDACISSGKVIITNKNIKLEQDVILKIEDILNRYNDKTARTKIKKLFLQTLEKK